MSNTVYRVTRSHIMRHHLLQKNDVQALIQNGTINVNYVCEDVSTHLIIATDHDEVCYIEVIELLLSHGADVNYQNKNNAVYLHCTMQVRMDIMLLLSYY